MPDHPENCIRVLIVDDHAIVRQGLRTFLELQNDIQVIGEAPNGRVSVEMAARLKPDVILMDLVMPEVDGIQATQQITALGIGSRIIALTSFMEEKNVIPAMQAGACGYLLKDVAPDNLVEAIRAASRGEVRIHPDVMRKLMEKVGEPKTPETEGCEELTDREIEVLQLVAKGLSNREIANHLVISEKTVKTHVSSLLSKLHQDDRTQLAIFALKNHLVPDQ